jgi:HEAT repeat protein
MLTIPRSHRRSRSFLPYAAFSFAILVSAADVALAQQRETASDLLRKFNGVTSFWQQPEIAQKIIALHDTSVLTQLEPLLNDPDRHKRGNAALIFAGLGDKRGFDVITAMLSDYSDRPQGQGFPGVWSVAEQIRADRYYAVHLLGLVKDPRAVPLLAAVLDDQDVNYNIPWALGQIGGPSAIEALINALQNNRTEVRLYSIEALVALGAKQALPQIRQLLDDDAVSHLGKPVSVADAARAAITTLEQPQ